MVSTYASTAERFGPHRLTAPNGRTLCPRHRTDAGFVRGLAVSLPDLALMHRECANATRNGDVRADGHSRFRLT